ncbi:MAG: hypothetical protein Q7T18_01370 [Sedimentisphaerales bacterium]|nr:hypothetical protein [Sedimentisphaerales bacterium]
MLPTTTPKKHKTGLFVFLTTFFLYVLASPGNLPGDTEVRWSIARQIVRNGCFCIEDTKHTNNYAVGLDGKRYSFYGPGQTALLVPLTTAGFVIEKVFHISDSTADLAAQFAASSILFPAIGAFVVLALYRLVLELHYSHRAAVISAMTLAAGTMLFHYSASSQEQPQVALLLLLAVIVFVKNRQHPRFFYAWLMCVLFGIALIFRIAAVTTFVPLCAIAALDEMIRRPQRLRIFSKWVFAATLGTGGFVLFLGWYNYTRFGSPFESGYALSIATSLGGHKLFESNPLYTLPAMLFSPGKSILLYNPVLLPVPFAVGGFFRKNMMLSIAIALVVAANFIFYSFYTPWAGDYAWSIRYQTAVLPLLILPLAHLFDLCLKRLFAFLVSIAITVSILIQIASVAYNFNLEFVQNPNHSLIPDAYVWDISQSHLVMRFDNIAQHIAGKRNFSSATVTNEEPFLFKRNVSEDAVRYTYGVNFFPFKAYAATHSNKLFYPLLGGWIVCLAAMAASAVQLFRYLPKRIIVRIGAE